MDFWVIWLIYLTVLSFVAFCVYVLDKRKAEKGKWRIPEKVLLLSSFFGGALGGLIAMNVVRHKTKKWYFWFVNLLGLLLHTFVFLFLVV